MDKCKHLFFGLLVTVTLNGCNEFRSGTNSPRELDINRLINAKDVWSAADVQNYQLTVVNSYWYARYTTVVEVQNNIVFSCNRVEIQFGNETETDCSAELNVPTVEKLFDMLQQMVAEKYEHLSVGFDKDYGYPTYIISDWRHDYVDDESSTDIELVIK